MSLNRRIAKKYLTLTLPMTYSDPWVPLLATVYFFLSFTYFTVSIYIEHLKYYLWIINQTQTVCGSPGLLGTEGHEFAPNSSKVKTGSARGLPRANRSDFWSASATHFGTVTAEKVKNLALSHERPTWGPLNPRTWMANIFGVNWYYWPANHTERMTFL